jgi:hypothetical protein
MQLTAGNNSQWGRNSAVGVSPPSFWGSRKVKKVPYRPGYLILKDRRLNFLTNYIPEEQDAQDASPTA